MPSLYGVVAEELIVWFSLRFYDLNRAMFKDDRVQHEAETQAMLCNHAARYASGFPQTSRRFTTN